MSEIDRSALQAETLTNELETAFLVDTTGKELYAFSHAQLARFNKNYSVSQILLYLLDQDANFVTNLRSIEISIKNLQIEVKNLLENGFNDRAAVLRKEINDLLNEYDEIVNTKLEELTNKVNSNKDSLSKLEEDIIKTVNDYKMVLIASDENLLYGTDFNDLSVNDLYQQVNQTFSFIDNSSLIDLKGEVAKNFENVPFCTHGNNILKITAKANENANEDVTLVGDYLVGLQYSIDEPTLRAYHKTLTHEGYIFSAYVYSDIKNKTKETFISPKLAVFNGTELVTCINPEEENKINFEDNSNPENNWKRLIYRFPFDICSQEVNDLNLRLMLPENMSIDGIDAIYTCDWKLEDGTCVTDWCCHLEEDSIKTSNQILSLEEKLEELKNKYFNFDTRIQNIESTIVVETYDFKSNPNTEVMTSEDVFAYLDLTGTLHFTGKGIVTSTRFFNSPNNIFEKDSEKIKRIIIDDDVKIVKGSRLFANLNNLEEFYGKLENLHESSYMFCNCEKLKVFKHYENEQDYPYYVLPPQLSNSSYMFYNCNNLEKIFIASNPYGESKTAEFYNEFSNNEKLKVLASIEFANDYATYLPAELKEAVPYDLPSIIDFYTVENIKDETNTKDIASIVKYTDGTTDIMVFASNTFNENNNKFSLLPEESKKKFEEADHIIILWSYEKSKPDTEAEYHSLDKNFCYTKGNRQKSLTFVVQNYDDIFIYKLGTEFINFSMYHQLKNVNGLTLENLIYDRIALILCIDTINEQNCIPSSSHENYPLKLFGKQYNYVGFKKSETEYRYNPYVNLLFRNECKTVEDENDLSEEIFNNTYYYNFVYNLSDKSMLMKRNQLNDIFYNTGNKCGYKNLFNEQLEHFIKNSYLKTFSEPNTIDKDLITIVPHFISLESMFEKCKVIYDMRWITDFSGKYLVSKMNREVEKVYNGEESFFTPYVCSEFIESKNKFFHSNYKNLFFDSNVKYLPKGIVIRSQCSCERMLKNCKEVVGEIDFFTVYNDVSFYTEENNPFGNCSTIPGSRLIVNYNTASEPILDAILALPNTGRNVIKGIKKKEFLPLRKYEEHDLPPTPPDKPTRTDISDSNITLDNNNFAYDGNAKEPNVEVSINKGEEIITLIKDTDYTVEYLNNIDVGESTIKITGIGNYIGENSTTFNIKYDITNYLVNVDKSSLTDNPSFIIDEQYGYPIYHTGTERTPDVIIKENDTSELILIKDTDYTVEYLNNIEIGTATINVIGIGNYMNIVSTTFEITEQPTIVYNRVVLLADNDGKIIVDNDGKAIDLTDQFPEEEEVA